MPAMLTHYSFCKEAIRDLDTKYPEAIYLGTQGPDHFFYFGIRPWKHYKKNYKEIQAYGGKIHHMDPTDTYWKMVEYALKAGEDKDLLFAYLDGLWMHYDVDRTFHPYIFHESGFDKDGKLTGYYKFSHGDYEALLDVQLGKKHGVFMNPKKAIEMDEEQVEKISKMWAYAADIKLDDMDFYLGYKDYCFAMNFLWSPSGFKRLIWRLGGKHNLLMAMSYPHNLKKYEGADQFNEQGRLWRHPVTGEESHETFSDLWEKAKGCYAKTHSLLERAYREENVKEELRAFTEDLNHDGFKNGSLPTHYSLAWDRCKAKK